MTMIFSMIFTSLSDRKGKAIIIASCHARFQNDLLDVYVTYKVKEI